MITAREEEIEQRVNILKKLKETLLRQREKFHAYLGLLEKEEESIAAGNIDRLEVQIRMEEEIVQEITNFQKIILPLDELYSRAYPVKEKSIPMLRDSLEKVRQRVLQRNKKNRVLLREKMSSVRHEIKSLRMKVDTVSPYADIGVPTLVDITT